jgi:hypothetical protein
MVGRMGGVDWLMMFDAKVVFGDVVWWKRVERQGLSGFMCYRKDS